MDTVTGNQNRRRRDWSSLNYDLTDHIFRKYLPFPDLLRCRTVCRSWRSVSRTILSSFPVNSPVLVIPKLYLPQKIIASDEESCHLFFQTFFPTLLCCFFNPVACELYPVSEKSKQLISGRFFLGLSKGWAFFNGVEGLVLFNAPAGVCIRIPCSVTASISIRKAFFWGGDPILDTKSKNNNINHGIVAIRDGYPPNISFSIWGNTTTKSTFQGFCCPGDAIYFNGLVYGVCGNGSFQSWDPNQGCTSTKVEPYMPTFNTGMRLRKLRLVDSSGELWLVSKFGYENYSKIRVCKMDFKERKWVEMDSLGDRVVVLCKNQSIAFSPLSPSEYKRNCVYFEDSHRTLSKHKHHCIYVYNLEDGSTVKSLLADCSFKT